MSPRTLLLDIHHKLICDLFAGGGGMSVAMEMAWGRSPDIAINHNDDALSLHRLNHPQTRHFVADVFEVCPRAATQGRPVGWLHLSPDCTHHSQARGGQPRNGKIRALAWVGARWAGQVRPDVISLENVKQFAKWGPLIAKRCRTTRRVIKLDGTVAAPGERVPVQQQYLIPDPRRQGRTFRAFRAQLEAMGYVVEFRTICAADHGGHTTRERLFMLARCDGNTILWPETTHYRKPARGQRRWKPAADCIDWSIPCPSIFSRARPLAEATMKRIATGIRKFVLECAQPFIVNMAHGGKVEDIRAPISTIATENGGCRALVAPVMVQAAHGDGKPDGVKRWGAGCRDAVQPLGTITASGGHAVAAAYLMQANDGFCAMAGRALSEPITTITNSGSQQQLVTAVLSPYDEAGALRVAAFLMRYYGEGGQWSDLRDPMTTITTKDRMALVTVTIRGTPYVIVDIGLRMLEPRELFRAQDFPDSYIIDRGHDGRRFSKSTQVRLVGNSVDPLMAVGFLRLNAPAMAVRRAA